MRERGSVNISLIKGERHERETERVRERDSESERK